MEIYDAQTDALITSQHRDPLLRHLTRVIVSRAQNVVDTLPSTCGIDVGCGVGRTTIALAQAGFPMIGVDPEPRVVRLAQRAARQDELAASDLAFYVGDATTDLPGAWHERFGLAVCSEVIEHVEQPGRVIEYATEALLPGGVLLLSTPHDPTQWTAMDTYAGHVRRFRADELRRLLSDAGLHVQSLHTEGFPFQRTVMAAYDRLLTAREADHRFDAYGSSMPYRVYTSIMPWFLRIDHTLRGLMRGTTLLAVARKP